MPTLPAKIKDPVLVTFGGAVRATRLSAGVSQEELAHRCGIDRSYMGAIERGEQNSGLLHLVRIAQALECTVSELMKIASL